MLVASFGPYVKLEPSRTTLSGRPEFLRPAAPVAVAAPVVAARKCVSCGCKDSILGESDQGEPIHTVTIELKFIEAANTEVAKRQISPRLAAKGWKYKFHLGRHAMERETCRNCLVAFDELAREFDRKRSGELKANMNSDSYYVALCGD